MASKSLGEELGRVARKANDVDTNIGKSGSYETILPAGFREEINLYHCRQREYTIDMTELDNNAFIIGDPTWGVLGSGSYLGEDINTKVLSRVYNEYNCFLEPLANERFIDTGSSTAIIDTNIYTVDFGSGDVFQSTVIAYQQGSNILSCRFELITDEAVTNDLTLYLSNDDGSSWEPASFNDTHFFDNVEGKEKLKYKIVATGSDQYIYGNSRLIHFKAVYAFD